MDAQSLLSQISILHPPIRHVTHVDEAMSVELPPLFEARGGGGER